MAGRNGRKKSEYYFDYSLLFIILFLVTFGMVMIYSASAYDSNTRFLQHQAIGVALGIFLMFFVARIPYHFWEHLSLPAYMVSAALILLVKTGLGVEANGAVRWLQIGPLTLQPAEVAKLAMIIFLSSMICKMGRKIRSAKGFWAILLAAAPHCLLVWKVTSNMSSAIIIFGIAFLMLFVASPDYKRFILLGAAGLSGAGLLVYVVSKAASTEGMSFRLERILAWLDPEAYASGKGFQTLQGLYAIGSGGIFGKGLGQSMQKLGYLPEQQNDMIFAIICEELGLFGAIAVILIFVLLIWRFMVIANNAPDLYGALLVVGVMGHIAVQVILNIAVVTNTIPNTGISLPFISYGGTSVMFLLVEMGIVMSVARGIRLKDV